MKIFLLFVSMIFFVPSLLMAEGAKNLAVFYSLEGNAEKEYNALVENKLKSIGFNLADPHHRVNDQYKTKYGSTTLDVLSFLPVVNDDNVMPLFNIDPRLAGFSPFNMLIYKKLEENTTHVGHLTPEAMLDIVGVTDSEVRQKFIDSFKPLDALMDKEFGVKTKSYVPFVKSKDGMLNFEYTFERPEDLDEFIEEFQNSFEMAFINKEYLIAGFHDFKDTDNGEEMLEEFDLFWAYSLCHLKYSYNMFDNKGARPDAGLFAPCTMYMYLPKDSNKLVIGMPKLVNVKDGLQIKDPKRIALVEKLDREIPEILTAFGMKAVTNVNPLKETPQPKFNPSAIAVSLEKVAKTMTQEPKEETKKSTQKAEEKAITTSKEEEKSSNTTTTAPIKEDRGVVHINIPEPPKVPEVVKLSINNQPVDHLDDRSIKFSKRVPPGYTGPRYGKKIEPKKIDANAKVGEVNAGRISAYLRGELMSKEEVIKALEGAGFTVLATPKVDKKGDLISVVFTNKALTSMASKKNRGFAASLRVLINKKENQISITNPIYMLKAFLQEDFDEAKAKKVLEDLRGAFKGLKNSDDDLKYQLLPKYQFMSGMPFYGDMEVIARGDDLLEKIKNNKRVLFVQKLDNGSTLIGVQLGKRTNKFTQRIGTNNAAMLPYPVLIEDGEAKMLEPKFYISIMYPKLKMSQFMTIATVPGAMIKDCTKVFK